MTGDRSIDETFEALLAGRPAPAGGSLAAFTAGVRRSAAPGRASAELAELITTGLLTDATRPAAAVSGATGPALQASGPPKWRPRMITDVIAGALAKIATAGTMTHAAAGTTLVVAGVVGAGAAGALPETLQEQVAAAFSAEAPAEGPAPVDPTTEAAPTPSDGSSATPAGEPSATPADGPSATPGAEPEPVGTSSSGPTAAPGPVTPAPVDPVTPVPAGTPAPAPITAPVADEDDDAEEDREERAQKADERAAKAGERAAEQAEEDHEEAAERARGQAGRAEQKAVDLRGADDEADEDED